MYYEFYNPLKIISGKGSLYNLPVELKRLNSSSFVVLTDKGIVKAGLIKKAENALDEAGMRIPLIIDDVEVEAPLGCLVDISRRILEIRCDCIVAIGGGSVLDAAKLVCVMAKNNIVDPSQIAGVDTLPKERLNLIAIPTTCGTGAEATGVCVAMDEKNNTKIAFADDVLIPDVAILDPALVEALPVRLVASSAIDALAHAIEAHISIQSNPLSDALSAKALSMIWKNLPEAINGDKNARFCLLEAANIAGVAFSNAMVGIIHSLAHAAGSILHIPHSEAVSLFILPGLSVQLEAASDKLADLLEAIPGIHEYSGDNLTKANRFLYLIERFLEDIKCAAGLPKSLTDYGYNDAYYDAIITKALQDGSSIFGRIKLTPEIAGAMIKQSLR